MSKFSRLQDYLKISWKKIFGLLIVLIVAGSLLILTSYFKTNGQIKAEANTPAPAVSNQLSIEPPTAESPINRDFTFNIQNDNGVDQGQIKYTLETAELRNEIVLKGQTATAVQGRTFLIINLKLKNDTNHTITVNTRDFVRLSVNNNTNQWLAPDIYNDPVDVQPISTKITRIGFAIADTDKSFKLQVGEIDGKKEIIDLKLITHS